MRDETALGRFFRVGHWPLDVERLRFAARVGRGWLIPCEAFLPFHRMRFAKLGKSLEEQDDSTSSPKV
jgi:hypothetical protein